MALKARVWRRKGEGLIITAKGWKDQAGGRQLHVIFAIAYNKGVILCRAYYKMNGKFFCVYANISFCASREQGRIEMENVYLLWTTIPLKYLRWQRTC